MSENIDLKLVFDNSDLQSAGLDTSSILKKMKADLEDTEQAMNKSFKSAAESLDKFEKKLIDSAGEIADQHKELDDAAKATDEYGKKIKSSSGSLSVFDSLLGGTIGNLKNKAASLRQVITTLGGATKGLKLFRVALISTGIGAIVVALGSLVALLARTQKGMDFVSTATAVVGSVVSVVLDRFAALGGAIVKLFKGDFKGAAEAAKAAASGIGDELAKATAETIRLQAASQNLRDQQIAFITKQAELENEIAIAREKMSDDSLTINERQAALNEVKKAETTLTDELIRQKKLELLLMEQKNRLGERGVAEREEEANLAAEILKLEAEGEANKRSYGREARRLRNEQKAAAKERRDEAAREAKALLDANDNLEKTFQSLNDAIKKGQIDQLKGSEKINAEYDFGIVQLNRQIDAIREQIKEAEALGAKKEEIAKRVAALEQFQIEAVKLATEERDRQLLNLERERLDKSMKANENFWKFIFDTAKKESKKVFDAAIGDTDLREAVSLIDVELMEKSTSKILTLEQEKAQKRLEISVQAERERLSAISVFYGENSPEAILLRKQIQLLERDLAEIGTKRDPIAKLKESLSDALGFTEEQFANIGDSLAQGFDTYLNYVNNLASQANERLDEIRGNREEVQKELADEQELQKQGLANNVEAKAEELSRLQVLENNAAKEAEKRQKAATRAQTIAQDAQQLSAITTAVTNIIAGWSKVPIVGSILGLAAAGLMLGSWVALKTRAKDSVKLYKGDALGRHMSDTRDSGLVKRGGRSDRHGRGHRIEDTNIEVGGGEYLVNDRVTASNLDFLDSFNSGKYSGLDMKSIAERSMRSVGVTNRIAGRQSEMVVIREMESRVLASERNDRLAKQLDASLKSNFDRLIHYHENQEEKLYPLFDGKFLKKRGNRKTITNKP